MSLKQPGIARAAVLALALIQGGCSSGGSLGALSSPAAPSARAASAPAASATRNAAPVDMVGRWTLAQSGGAACGMNFGSGGANTPSGSIAPEGGCPGNFYTSRKWSFEHGSLVIRDHTGKPLAQFAMASPAQFQGQGGSGAGLTLSR